MTLTGPIGAGGAAPSGPIGRPCFGPPAWKHGAVLGVRSGSSLRDAGAVGVCVMAAPSSLSQYAGLAT